MKSEYKLFGILVGFLFLAAAVYGWWTWYDSGQKPPKPPEMEKELESNGSMFIGSKGKLICGTYGENPRLLPESQMKDFVKPLRLLRNSANRGLPTTSSGVPEGDQFNASKRLLKKTKSLSF